MMVRHVINMALWDAIVCTCQNRESANAFLKELEIRRQLGWINPNTLLLTVEDPKPNIGSGSALLNALLCVAERLSARRGLTSLDPHTISDARILVLLLGTTFPFSACGHAFMPNADIDSPDELFQHNIIHTNMDQLMDVMKQLLGKESPKGVWVCSTDMLLQVEQSTGPLDLSHVPDCGIGVLTMKVQPQYAAYHGACKLTSERDFASIMYKAGEDQTRKLAGDSDNMDMIAGIVYIRPKVSEILVSWHVLPPLDSCTYIALDSGAKPVSVSLFFDIFMCLTKEMTAREYEESDYFSSTTAQPSTSQDQALLRKLKATMWRQLVEVHKVAMKAVPLEHAQHKYLKVVAQDLIDRHTSSRVQSGKDYVMINSRVPSDIVVGKGSLLMGCDIVQPNVQVGQNCLLSGINGSLMAQSLMIPDNIALQEFRICVVLGRAVHGMGALVVYGVKDDLGLQYPSAGLTYCNAPWEAFLERTGISESDLWQHGYPKAKRSLLTARLFPVANPDALIGPEEVLWLAGILRDTSGATLHRWRSSWRLSLNEILRCVDCEAELQRIRRICFQQQKKRMFLVFQQGQDVHLRSFFQSTVVQGMHGELLEALDDVVTEIQNARMVADSDSSVLRLVCRVYASIADVLGYMAGEDGGIRAGPASNVAWARAFALLDAAVKTRDLIPATKALAEERSKWINNGSELLIRAARHYEKAAQKLTLIMVDTCTEFVKLTKTATLPAIGQEVVATLPVRIDLAGGWSDTPPVCYEHGGRVATLAIRWKNEKPVKSVAKRIPELKIKVTWGDGWEDEFTELSHFSDYSQPSASAALLKCAFIVSGIVDYPSNESLSGQLKRKLGSGVELTTFANVPIGSGLGTSSILGAAVLATLFHISGLSYDLDSLVHATLKVEQLLTSGGGWQDQCGGLYPGAKLSESPRSDKLHVSTRVIDVADGFIDKLNRHLHLVYTGRTRLAKNLLQDVLRRWHSREKTVVQAINGLVSNAAEAEEAMKTGDLAKLGSCVQNYRNQKLVMAPGSIPSVVYRMIEEIQDDIHGCCLSGAGGGGFLAIIAKEEGFEKKLQSIIETVPDLKHFEVYPTQVDMEGLTVS